MALIDAIQVLGSLAQIEQIQGLLPTERMQRARGGAFLLDRPKPSPDAVELVGGGKAEQVRERMPLEDARVDVDLVPGDRVGRHAAVGKLQRGRELLRAVRTHRDARGELLARERAVALDADGDRALEEPQRNEQQPEERPRHEAQGVQAEERGEAGDHEDRAQRQKHRRAEQPRQAGRMRQEAQFRYVRHGAES